MSAWVTPITWTSAAVTVSQMNVGIRDKMNWLKDALDNNGISSDVGKAKLTPALVGSRIRNSVAQTITSGVSSQLTFDTERFDSDAFHAAGLAPFVIPAGMAGYYFVGAHIGWAGNATGYRRLRLMVNSTDYIASQSSKPSSTEALLMSVETLYQFAVGDTIHAMVFQTSGGNLDVSGTVADNCEFWIHRISSS